MDAPHKPEAPDAPTTDAGPPRLHLSALLKRAAVDARGQHIGRLADVIVRLAGTDYPVVTGLVAAVGKRQVFIPAEAVRSWHTERVELADAQIDLRAFERRDGEVLLHRDVLGHRLIDVDRARLVRAHDIQLTATPPGWLLTGVDVHRGRWLHLPGRHEHPEYRDWATFEPLIGHQSSIRIRAPLGRLRRLKPAQLADLLEAASNAEQNEILSHVHHDPELEADVFEELAEDGQARLFATRSDAQVAEVIGRMRADNAADAITDLPQPRRQPILDLLPPAQHTKVMTLLGYNTATAGGLMGVEYLTLPASTSVADAVAAVAAATTIQPEALANIYTHDEHGRLAGVAAVVTLLQTTPTTPLHAAAQPNPVRVHPHADLIEVTTLMADHNLLTLPVIDENQQIIGLITIDDVLEATIPHNWRHREHTPGG